MIKLSKRAEKAPFSGLDEDRDQGWQGRFVRIRTADLIPADKLSFPEKWNPKRLSKATRIRGQETAETSADEQDTETLDQGDLVVRRKRKSSESSRAPSQAKKRSRVVTRETSSEDISARALDAEVVGQLLDHFDDDDQVSGGHRLIDELLEHDLTGSVTITPPLVESSSRIPTESSGISKSTDAGIVGSKVGVSNHTSTRSTEKLPAAAAGSRATSSVSGSKVPTIPPLYGIGSVLPIQAVASSETIICIQDSPPPLVDIPADDEKAKGKVTEQRAAGHGGYEIPAPGMLGFEHLPIPVADRFGVNSGPRLEKSFPAPSVDPSRKRLITFKVSADMNMLSGPVGVSSYMYPLVSQEDRKKIVEVDESCLFNEAQHALNRASVLHHASFNRLRHEVGRLKEELKSKSQEVDELMTLYEKKLQYISSLPDLSILKSDLAAARNEAAEAKRERDQLAEKVKAFETYNKSLIADANVLASQARAYVSQIDRLRAELDGIRPEFDALHETTIGAVAERDVLREQLRTSVEQMNGLSASLAAAEVERDRLSRVITDLQAEHGKALDQISGYDDMLEQYKADVTAAEKASNLKAEYERCLSRRKTLEEVQATGVDLSNLIEEAKKLEAEAKAAFDPEDSDIDLESADEEAEGSDED
ncbi:uncharacterized protein LOC132042689 [Lycium ferocissimum]|uniref:uncharacterized protein LOC132042689 n=1 Tax=Lycium ferocissimum TaxID=112874 RepID=UPI002816478C|nr:uncharacterized protein LOC132042689 [Lycium ferocissimum]